MCACCFAAFCVDVGLLVLHFVCIWFVVRVVCCAVCCCLLLLAMLHQLVWGYLYLLRSCRGCLLAVFDCYGYLVVTMVFVYVWFIALGYWCCGGCI